MIKSFKEMAASGNNLMVVDALNLCFSFRGKVNFAEAYVNMVQSLRRSYKAKYVIIACDKGSSSYRKGIYPEYKQNRKDKFELQTEAERIQFEIFFQEFEKALTLLEESTEYPLLRFQGVEADDIGAYICSKIKEFPAVEHTWLITSDGDWDLLIAESISRFSYVTRKEVTLENWHERYDFEPEDYISIKCLTGDMGDNVIGVAGIGPKRAASLVQEYGTAIDIACCIPIDSKYKYVQELNKSKDLIMLNYNLMDLVTFCAEAIGEPNCEIIDNTLTEYLV
jgi:5'-3' exonuclease